MVNTLTLIIPNTVVDDNSMCIELSPHYRWYSQDSLHPYHGSQQNIHVMYINIAILTVPK